METNVIGLSCSKAGRFTLYGAGMALLVAIGCRRGGESSPAAAPRDANILLITLDTTRADHLTCYAGKAKTPHLDALAARGALFTEAIAQAPLTLPSHASIMTGKYPPVHGLRDMQGFALDRSHATLASITKASGFMTAAFVGSRVLARPFGLAYGFDTYDDDMGRQRGDVEQRDLFAERRAAAVTDRAIEWLSGNRQSRFFLWVHYFDPHAPYDPPEPYKRSYAGDPYSGEVAYMDEQAGRLLAALEQAGLASRTLVAVFGDHGESLGEHGEATHGVFLYDSTLRVPFILAGPDVPPGTVIRQQVRSIDLLPTLLAFLKLEPGPDVQGVSIWPLLRQETASSPVYSYSETLYPRSYMGWSELAAMRADGWKLIVAPRRELYDLRNDPGETRNLAAEHQGEVDRLGQKIRELDNVRRKKATPGPADTKILRQLESLGYVSGGMPRQTSPSAPAPDPKDRVEVLKILTQAEDLFAKKEYARAARLMEEGLRLDPTNPRCHISLAMAYEKMGQYKRAIEVFKHALGQRIETDKIYSRMGIDYLHLGDMENAVEAMAQARLINPADLDNLLNLGMAYLQLGRVDQAEQAFKAITAEDELYAGAHNGLGLVAVQRGDAGTARREFERAVQINPDDAKSLLDLGILHQQLGNREQALHHLQSFLRKAPPGQFSSQLPAVREAIRELQPGRGRMTADR